MLLLSGVKDEVVPPEHMQGLWELVQQRVPGGYRGGAVVSSEEGASVSKDESVRNPGGNGFSRYVEFQRGTHSKSFLSSFITGFLMCRCPRRYMRTTRVLVGGLEVRRRGHDAVTLSSLGCTEGMRLHTRLSCE